MPRATRTATFALLFTALPAFGADPAPRQRPDNIAAAAAVPTLAEMETAPQRIAPLVLRHLADRASVEHVHDIGGGARREVALRAFHEGWKRRLGEVDYRALSLEDRIDWQLLSRDVEAQLEGLDFEAGRRREAQPLLPGIAPLLELAEAQRNLAHADAQRSAQVLDDSRAALVAALLQLRSAPPSGEERPTAAVANRAARIVDATRGHLKSWFDFHAEFDPAFGWWNRTPYAALDPLLGEYAQQLRVTLAGAADPEAIVGDPIGRDALLRALRRELIPYTPEELLELAEKELAWCRREMQKAARELGYDDWRQALEHVKRRHVAPGEQPQLVLQLADEAIDFLDEHELVTVPALARRDWRMTMLDPRAQLEAPFFLGGEDVWIAFPTAGMPYDKKLDSLRGNNRHFSRAVVHHELIPGHHLQHFYTARYQPQRERLGWNPFWGEGWALYWEFLLWDRGFAQSPEDRIGMLFWRSHRAARIRFSLGFHLGTMTPDEAITLLVDDVGHERENAAAEVRRSFAGDYGPLYQAAYMLGGLQFRALHAELVGGGRMNEREFHDRILKGGPMPVALVRMRLRGESPPRTLRPEWRFYEF